MKIEDVRIGKQYLCSFARNIFVCEATKLLVEEWLEVDTKIIRVIYHDWGFDPVGFTKKMERGRHARDFRSCRCFKGNAIMPKRPKTYKQITFVHNTLDADETKMANLLMDYIFTWCDFHGHLNDFELDYKNDGHNKKAHVMVPAEQEDELFELWSNNILPMFPGARIVRDVL